MRDEIKRKLNIVQELYPAERLNASKRRWRNMWNRELPEDRYPFTYGWPMFNVYNVNHPPKERLNAYLDGLAVTGKFQDDLIPGLFPGLNHATIPSMFGAEEIRIGMETACKKLIVTAEDIDRLEEPRIVPGSPAQYWLDMEQYVMEETEGSLDVHVCDMQGPFDMCAQLWSYDELILCAFEDPERYDRLMSLATEAFIMLWEAQENILGECFTGTHLFGHDWIPPQTGATLSADGLVMCSPSFYLEFVGPYIERIARRLGGAVVHSCGDFRHVMKALCQTEGLRGVNASQLTVEQMTDAGLSDKTVVAFTSIDELEHTMSVVRTNQLGFVPTIGDFYPLNAQGIPAEMNADDANLQKKHERVLSVMSCTP